MRKLLRKKHKNKNRGAGQPKDKKGKAEPVVSNVPDPFYCKLETVRIKKNGSNIVPVTFLPFELGVHK
jgi:hypothetical protein